MCTFWPYLYRTHCINSVCLHFRYEAIIDRLVQRLAEQVDHDDELAGISFDEFRDFCLFLNNLDDFQIAMRMYTLADKAIAPGIYNVVLCNIKKIVVNSPVDQSHS